MNIKKICLLIAVLTISSPSFAKKKAVKSAINPRVQTSMVVDAESGKILHNVNGHERIYPASLTKLMTIYMAFDALEKGKLTMEERLHVSARATKVIPLKLNLKPGQTISTKDAILGMVVHSANDASNVIGEAVSGTQEKFAVAMTKKAHELGMKNTEFYNAHGLHHPNQKTTATDLVKLTLALKRDFPQYYDMMSATSMQFEGKTVATHNRVLKNYEGAEAGKTGFTNPAGLNLVIAAKRGDKKLIGVVTGSNSRVSRDDKMVRLLDSHFGVSNDVFANAPTTVKKVEQASSKKKLVIAKAKMPVKKFAAKKTNKISAKKHLIKKSSKVKTTRV